MKSYSRLPAALHFFGVSILLFSQVSSPAGNELGTVVSWGQQVIPYVQPGTRYQAIAAGGDHSLALKSDGTVVAWGDNSFGESMVPANLTGVIAIAAGLSHGPGGIQEFSLALKSDGTVIAWGSFGLTNVPPGLMNVTAIAAGGVHSLALKSDGTVVAWGYNLYGATNVPANLTGVIGIAAGYAHSLALKSDGTVVAWGANDVGQTNIPAGLGNVVAIAAGCSHSLALKSDGTVVAWGYSLYGATNEPANLTGVIAIASGCSHSLALKSDGTVVAWAYNYSGQTNVPANLTSVIAIAAGESHSLALKSDGTAVAWGDNSYGQSMVPANLTSVTAIAAGESHSLALKSDGTIVAWEDKFNGQSTVPANLTSVTAIAAGGGHSLALKLDGTVVAWGANGNGQIMVPANLTSVTAIAAGWGHSLALKSDGTIVAWGNGQIMVPANLTSVTAIAAGGGHSLALKSDGTIIPWGDNSYGQSTVPANLTSVTAIAAGGYNSLALRSDGTVVAWGSNNWGQTNVPANLTGVIAIAAGGRHSLALKNDGTVVAWGDNSNGQTNVPSGLPGVVAIAGGKSLSLALVASAPGVAVSITSQPQSQTAPSGANVTLSVSSTGTSPLNFQWHKDGANIAGATTATFILTSVGAASSGGYSVTVWNAYGSVVSDTASLAVLTDGANGNQAVQPIYPVLPASETGKDSLVFITHGRTPSGDSGEHPWVDDMETAIKDQASPNWMVLGYKWDDIPPDPGTGVPNGSRTGIFAVLANARDVGRKVGRDLMELAQLTPNHKWEHVHLIAHSAGSRLIEEASKIIDAESPTTTIHTTFLDAYTGVTDTGRSKYGSASDWADSYFAVDTDTYDKVVGRSEGPLEGARNTDITWLDPNVRTNKILCSSASPTAGSTPPLLDVECGYEASSTHRWPYDFYLRTILGTAPSCATGYGFPRSKEGGGWDDRASYPVGNSPTVLCGSPPVIQNPSLFSFNQPLQINSLPNATSSSGVNRFGNSFTLTSTPSSPAPQQNTKQDGPIILKGGPTPDASGQPVWLAVGVTVTNAVNFVQFEATFSTTNAAEGLMAVYWNTNQIGTVDERVGEPTLETYRFGLPDIVTNGLYTLSFRLDIFTNMSSTITITNVTTGFAGLDQPISLDVLLGSNSVPVLKLTGTSNFTYLVESSTNLLNWSPAALISNTNGTVLFTDPSATNSNQRFYRATTP